MYRDFPDLSPRSSRIPPYSLPSNHVLSRCFLFLPVALLTVTRKRPASSPGPPPPSPGRNRFILHFLDLSFRPQKHYISCSYYSPKKFTLFALKFKTDVKHCWIFLFYFLLSYLPEETYFQQSGIFCGGRRYPLKSPKGLYPSPMRNTTKFYSFTAIPEGEKEKRKK